MELETVTTTRKNKNKVFGKNIHFIFEYSNNFLLTDFINLVNQKTRIVKIVFVIHHEPRKHIHILINFRKKFYLNKSEAEGTILWGLKLSRVDTMVCNWNTNVKYLFQNSYDKREESYMIDYGWRNGIHPMYIFFNKKLHLLYKFMLINGYSFNQTITFINDNSINHNKKTFKRVFYEINQWTHEEKQSYKKCFFKLSTPQNTKFKNPLLEMPNLRALNLELHEDYEYHRKNFKLSLMNDLVFYNLLYEDKFKILLESNVINNSLVNRLRKLHIKFKNN